MKMKNYRKFPEQHPCYSTEWQIFWAQKYKKVMKNGGNPQEYDYKPEWIEFWTVRMEELHKKEVETKRKEFVEKLKLAKKSDEEFCMSPRPRASRRRTIEISDDESEPRRKLSRSEIPRDFRENSRKFGESSRHRFVDYDRGHVKSLSPASSDDCPVSLISVCRLLSALESELGLLAPMVIDLLGKSVALEKVKPNSADALLHVSDYCNLLDTAKEKLKGILSANIIAPNRISVVKRAIQNIAQLMHEISAKKTKATPEKSFEASANNSSDPRFEAKMQIATAMAANLKLQGRSDVSSHELEILVEEFINSNNEENLEKEKVKNDIEFLNDEDLKTLLRNFSDLSEEEQKHLIDYLAQIEKKEPKRVEMLKKYLNTGLLSYDSGNLNIKDSQF